MLRPVWEPASYRYLNSVNSRPVLEETTSVNELADPAGNLVRFAGDQRIFLFYGGMGAGKTTFIKAVCKALGVTDAVSSPTFSIVNEYESPEGPVYHFDFYRLKQESEAFDLGFEDYLYSGNYCLIEWPEKVGRLLPDHYLEIKLEPIDEAHRKLTAVHI